MPVEESERGTFVFSSKDLCMIDHLPDMINAGIDSLKVEGRMKNPLYVASVARTYRCAIDDYFEFIRKEHDFLDKRNERIKNYCLEHNM